MTRGRVVSGLRTFAGFVGEVYGGWTRHRCTQLSAAMAFYGIFSLVPVLLLMTSIFGYVLASWAGAPAFKESIARLIADAVSPQISHIATSALAATERARGQLGLVSIGALTLAATGAFGMLESSLQIVWDLHVEAEPLPFRIQVIRFVRTRLISFVLVVGAALIGIFAQVADIVFDAIARRTTTIVKGDWRWMEMGMGLVVSGLIVTLLFRWLPLRRVPWRAALVGGWLTAGLWELARQGLSAYLTRIDYAMAYPILGSAMAILIWVYLAAIVFLLGAEVAAAITRMMARARSARTNGLI